MSLRQAGFLKDVAELTGIAASNTPTGLALPPQLYPSKARIALLGTVGAGKSTVEGLLGITAETLVRDTEETSHPFLCQVIEHESEIHQDKSNLRNGHFPKKTQAYTGYASEAGFGFEWQTKWAGMKVNTKYLHLPICDLAGEDIQQSIRQVVLKKDIGAAAKQKVANLIGYMRESDGFIICLKGTRAQGFKKQLEPEKDKMLSEDPDVNMVRLLQDLACYKISSQIKPIIGMAVIVTASDKVQREVGDDMGFDITTHYDSQTQPRQFQQQQRDMLDFVASCFPATYAAIRSLKVPNVQFFPSYVELETDPYGVVQYWPEDPDSPKIACCKPAAYSDEWRHKLRKIKYSELWYIDLINWLRTFAASA